MERIIQQLQPEIDEHYGGGYSMEKDGRKVAMAGGENQALSNRVMCAVFLPHLVSCNDKTDFWLIFHLCLGATC